jgi:hypothetical protein
MQIRDYQAVGFSATLTGIGRNGHRAARFLTGIGQEFRCLAAACALEDDLALADAEKRSSMHDSYQQPQYSRLHKY